MNKFAAAILVAGLVALATGKITNAIYHPGGASSKAEHGTEEAAKRGYQVDVADAGETVGAGAETETAAPVDIAPLLATADTTLGESISKKCTTCHDFSKGGPNKVGPNLFGIVGAAKAHQSNYAYSPAMAAKGGSWDVQAISDFLEKPKGYVPGTKMAFAGLKKPEDRAALIAYLKTLK